MMQMRSIKKLTLLINTALLAIVFFMTFAFAYYRVTYMVYHSIPTVAVYVALYWLIHKDKLDLYVWILYIVITAYMIAATICLGYSAGYHFYCASLIPLAFYMEYLAHVLHTRKVNALLMSVLLVIIYLLCTSYTLRKGPVYTVEPIFIFRCMIGNALGVFSFLIGYTRLINKLVISSEDRLSEAALKDQLTGLFNRHYIMTYMDALYQKKSANQWVAMVDIDGFKGINDSHGHHGGDYVLTMLAGIMRQVCGDCVIARWGGEEFLIVADGTTQDPAMLETLRKTVNETAFLFEGNPIPVSVTIGAAVYAEDQSIDHWIRSADRKLYIGKNNGKNQVVY